MWHALADKGVVRVRVSKEGHKKVSFSSCQVFYGLTSSAEISAVDACQLATAGPSAEAPAMRLLSFRAKPRLGSDLNRGFELLPDHEYGDGSNLENRLSKCINLKGRDVFGSDGLIFTKTKEG